MKKIDFTTSQILHYKKNKKTLPSFLKKKYSKNMHQKSISEIMNNLEKIKQYILKSN